MEDINYETLIYKRITLEPNMLNTNLEQHISELVKAKYGNKYLQEGYVKKESIEVIKRSMLQQIPNKFNGDMITNVIFKAIVINPVKGNVIVGKISGINKAGFLVNQSPFIINVLIEQHENKALFKDLKVGDEVRLVVIATKYNQKNNTIMIIAKLEEEYNNKKMKIKIKSKKSKKEEDILEKEYNEEINKDIQEGGETVDVDDIDDVDEYNDEESNKSDDNDEVNNDRDETESIENKKINNETGEEEFDENNSNADEDDEDIDKDLLDDELEDPEDEEESEEEETEEEEINHIEDAE